MARKIPQTQKPITEGPFLSVSQAAELLTVSKVFIRRYLSLRKLKRYKVGARTLVSRTDVLNLVREE
jgi:excisionase family DNA binding protein